MAFWNLGSMSGSTWRAVLVVLPCVVVGLAISGAHARKLDLLALGERQARHLGVDTERLRLTLVVVAALLVASGVAFTGIIAFIGLVVPHVIRMLAGPGHRLLVPAATLGGAVVLVLADLVARTVIPYQELPLGVLTALIGGPFFFYLLLRSRAPGGGWR
jgi:iron complex transport system permease protein